jgi:hypothetical protein
LGQSTDYSRINIPLVAEGPGPLREDEAIHHPVTRPIPLRCLPLLGIFGLIVLAIAAIFNIIAGGYEHIAVNSPDFNKTITLWYQRSVPHRAKSYTPEEWNCTASTIRYGDSNTHQVDQSDGSTCDKLMG